LSAAATGLIGATSNTFNITLGPVAKFAVSAPASATAGSAATGITLTAQDAGGNTVPTYAGSHAIAWSGAGSAPNGTAPTYPATSVSFASGVSTTSLNATFFKAETVTLVAKEGASPSGSAVITVNAGARSRLTFTSSSLDCSGGTVAVGNGGTWTSKVSTADTWGNVAVAGSLTSVTLSNNQGNALLSPTSLSVGAAASESSASFSQGIPNGNPPTYTATAAASGLTPVTCGVHR
jgi:hypothetical protein